MDKKEDTQKEIEKLIEETVRRGADKMKLFLGLNQEDMMNLYKTGGKYILDIQREQAKIGLDLYREQNVQARASAGLSVRVYHMIAEDKKEFKQLVSKSLPSYLPR